MGSSEKPSYSYEYFSVSFPKQYVAHVEINRPEKLNAFIEIMWLNMRKIFEALSDDPDVRVVVLSGAGRAFTAGLDVQAASTGNLSGATSVDSARTARALRTHILEFQACISAIAACTKPVIAAVHGFCYGLGVDASSACDVRVCATDARFSVREVDIGLAADIGTLTRLPRCVGSASWVKEVCLSAREWGAEEAARVGFVSRAVAGGREGVLAEALKVAEGIAGKSPVAVWGTKEILDWSAERGTEDGLRYTAIWNAAMLQTEDVKKALLSGLRRTKPVFGKL